MTVQTADVLVLGGGTMGTAAGWALARQGVKVVVLEQFGHVHSFGSHGGKTRIFRHAYAEGARYVPWALEADRLWSELQERTGNALLHRIGCIDVSGPGNDRARNARASAEQYGLAHEWLTGADVNARWPLWHLPDDREVCDGPGAGYLDVAASLRSLAAEMTAAGGVLRDNTPVLSWSATESGVRVETADGAWEGDRLVVTAGAWTSRVLAELGIPLEVRRKPVLWFSVDPAHASLATPDRCPVFICDDEYGDYYGIPEAGRPAGKTGRHDEGDVVDPETIDRTVHAADSETDILPFIRRNLSGFTGEVIESAVCMYTMTPDEDFVIDRHPGHDRVAFAGGFSGHGFKFTPVVGEYLATLVTSPEAAVKPEFALARFATNPGN